MVKIDEASDSGSAEPSSSEVPTSQAESTPEEVKKELKKVQGGSSSRALAIIVGIAAVVGWRAFEEFSAAEDREGLVGGEVENTTGDGWTLQSNPNPPFPLGDDEVLIQYCVG